MYALWEGGLVGALIGGISILVALLLYRRPMDRAPLQRRGAARGKRGFPSHMPLFIVEGRKLLVTLGKPRGS